MRYFIGTDEFFTKKSAKEMVHERIKGMSCGFYSIDSIDGQFLFSVLENHSEVDEKIGVGISGFEVNPALDPALHKSGKGKHICLIRVDGTTEDFSYNHCLTFPLKGKKEFGIRELKCALRESITPQIKQFIEDDNGRDIPLQYQHCPECGLLFEEDNPYHVDHIIPFSKLVEDFMTNDGAKYKIPNSYARTLTRRWVFKPSDKCLEEDFLKYHAKNARYQFLCRMCNISKSNH